MRNIFGKLTLALLAIVLVSNESKAQYWEVGGSVGSAFYFGDLNTEFSLKRPGLAVGFMARRNFVDHRLCLKAGVNYARVGFSDALSDNAFQQMRNLSFRSDIIEGTLQFEFNFMPYLHGDREKWFTPYLLGGLTVFHFNPKTEINGRWYDLRPLGTEGQRKNDEYPLLQPAIAYGGGFKVDLNYAWSLNLEISGRKLFTDYLDDVSGVYTSPADLQEARGSLAVQLADRSWEVSPTRQPVMRAGMQRGDKRGADSYAIVSLGLVYNFAQVKCPEF